MPDEIVIQGSVETLRQPRNISHDFSLGMGRNVDINIVSLNQSSVGNSLVVSEGFKEFPAIEKGETLFSSRLGQVMSAKTQRSSV